MVLELSKQSSIEQAITVTNGAAGTSDVNGATFDMQGFESITIIVVMGAITSGAVTSVKAQQGAQSDASDMADLLGSAQTIADDDDEDTYVIDIIQPQERYVRVVVDRATQNAVISSGIYIATGSRKQPTAHGSTINVETHVQPAEGTA